ncbi:hypothetical protein QJQ45_004082 [Haematococcus lacustris]|nr:hypothetical protein QJQ45_004082 [Haematococcus lacustris]
MDALQLLQWRAHCPPLLGGRRTLVGFGVAACCTALVSQGSGESASTCRQLMTSPQVQHGFDKFARILKPQVPKAAVLNLTNYKKWLSSNMSVQVAAELLHAAASAKAQNKQSSPAAQMADLAHQASSIAELVLLWQQLGINLAPGTTAAVARKLALRLQLQGVLPGTSLHQVGRSTLQQMVATLKAQLPELSGSELALALTAVSHGRCSSPGLKEAVAQVLMGPSAAGLQSSPPSAIAALLRSATTLRMHAGRRDAWSVLCAATVRSLPAMSGHDLASVLRSLSLAHGAGSTPWVQTVHQLSRHYPQLAVAEPDALAASLHVLALADAAPEFVEDACGLLESRLAEQHQSTSPGLQPSRTDDTAMQHSSRSKPEDAKPATISPAGIGHLVWAVAAVGTDAAPRLDALCRHAAASLLQYSLSELQVLLEALCTFNHTHHPLQTMAAGLLRARGFRHPFDSAPTASCLLSLARLGAGEEGRLARELLHPSLTTLGSSSTSTLLPPGAVCRLLLAYTHPGFATPSDAQAVLAAGLARLTSHTPAHAAGPATSTTTTAMWQRRRGRRQATSPMSTLPGLPTPLPYQTEMKQLAHPLQVSGAGAVVPQGPGAQQPSPQEASSGIGRAPAPGLRQLNLADSTHLLVAVLRQQAAAQDETERHTHDQLLLNSLQVMAQQLADQVMAKQGPQKLVAKDRHLVIELEELTRHQGSWLHGHPLMPALRMGSAGYQPGVSLGRRT